MAEGGRDWNDRYATGQTPWDSGAPSLEMQRVVRDRAIAPRRMKLVAAFTPRGGISTSVTVVHEK